MIKLYNGDCLEVMNEIPDGSIDMVLTDIPFNISKEKRSLHTLETPFYCKFTEIINYLTSSFTFAALPTLSRR